ncbi:MAG: tetratricopeptide repeat protein [Pirellulaceae bacterium]
MHPTKTWLGLVVLLAAGGIWYAATRDSSPTDHSGETSATLDPALEPPKHDAASTHTSAHMEALEPHLAVAEQVFRQQFPGVEPTRDDLLFVAGELAMSSSEFDRALACYQAVSTDHPQHGLPAKLQIGVALVELNRAAEAEVALQAYISAARLTQQRIDPQDVVSAFKFLTFILSVELRLEDRRPLMQELHTIGLADPFDSKQLYFPNLLILNSPAGQARLTKFLEVDPHNVDLQIAQGRYYTLQGKFDEAIALLQAVSGAQPTNRAALAALWEAHFQAGNTDEFAMLLAAAPDFAADEPWLMTTMRGENALENKNFALAKQHFQAVLAGDPAHAPAQMGLAFAYAGLKDEAAHATALARSSVLAEIRVNLSSVQADAAAASQELSDKCQQIGFDAAATTFARHAETIRAATNP